MIWIQNLTCFHDVFELVCLSLDNHFGFQFKAKLYRIKVIHV